MARGKTSFKQADGVRLIRIARAGGIEPAMVEIVCPDGVIFRIYSDKTAPAQQGIAKEWAAEIDKLQGGK